MKKWRDDCWRLLEFILFITTLISADGLKLISFKARYAVQKDLSPSEFSRFEVWFNEFDTKEKILQSNPGIQKIKKIEDSSNVYIADLSPIHFPGLTVKTRIKFSCTFENNQLIVQCNEQNMEKQFEGSKVFASIVSKLFPEVISTSTYSYEPKFKQLNHQAELIIRFHLPSWFPLGGEMIEKKGSETIQKGLIKDLEKTIDEVIQLYKVDRSGFVENSQSRK